MSEWLKRGYEIADKREKEIEERRKNTVRRFWLKPEGTTKIVFLDDNPPIIDEHQVKIDGDWKHWFTCNSVIGAECPHCKAGNKPSVTGFYTILDMSEWTDSKGNVHRNERQLFSVKLKTLKKLKRASAKQRAKGFDGLVGCVFEVYRTDSDAPNTGDDYEFIERLTEEELKDLVGKNGTIEPFDYAQILAPKTEEEMNKALKESAETTSEEYGDDDDIDF